MSDDKDDVVACLTAAADDLKRSAESLAFWNEHEAAKWCRELEAKLRERAKDIERIP